MKGNSNKLLDILVGMAAQSGECSFLLFADEQGKIQVYYQKAQEVH